MSVRNDWHFFVFFYIIFMKTVQVQYDFGITTSDKGNAVLFFDIVTQDGVISRNF